jgi:3-hydroxybutyryl-CoA dehydrogenase
MDIKKAAVVGGGTMGSGIAHVFAQSGIQTVMIEARQDIADKALKSISTNMDRQVAKGTITAEVKTQAIGRLTAALSLDAARDADIVVEAVPEVFALKKEVFGKLDAIAKPDAILASNTSSLPITTIAAATKRPEKVVGMHFMNPVPVMKLVELIRGFATSDATYKAVHDLTLKLGKTPACSKDFPGFLANRILMPMINEAAFALMEGVGSREDIDTTMKLGMGHPMGPLTLADFVGLDTMGAICDVLFDEFRERRFARPPTLRKMLMAGWYGRKSGMGFYDYSGDEPVENKGLV